MTADRQIETAWESYWADCVAGGSPESARHATRDAFFAGAAAGLVAAEKRGTARAWREVLLRTRGEQMADVAPSVGLRPVAPVAPAGYVAS